MDQFQTSQQVTPSVSTKKRVVNIAGLLIGAIVLNFGAALMIVPYGFILGAPVLIFFGAAIFVNSMRIFVRGFSYARNWIVMGIIFVSLGAIGLAGTTESIFLYRSRSFPLSQAGYTTASFVKLGLFTLIGPTLLAMGIRLKGKVSLISMVLWWLICFGISLFAIVVATFFATSGVPLSD